MREALERLREIINAKKAAVYEFIQLSEIAEQKVRMSGWTGALQWVTDQIDSDPALLSTPLGEPQPSAWSYDMEAAPKDGTRILLANSVRMDVGHWQTDSYGYGYWADRGSSGFTRPHAWMPLPAPPSTVKEGSHG